MSWHLELPLPSACLLLFYAGAILCSLDLSQDGWSPLILASKNGNVEVVDKLLQQGAMVDIQNQVCICITSVLHKGNQNLGLLTVQYLIACDF